MSGLFRDPKISLIIDEKWRNAVLPIDDLEINSDFKKCGMSVFFNMNY